MAKVIRVIGDLSGSRTDVAALPGGYSTGGTPSQGGFLVKAGTAASIQEGYLVIKDGSNAGYAKAAADACDSTAVILGVATSASTETAAADGYVTVQWMQNLLVEIYAKTPASLAISKLISSYILDVTSGNYKLDEATTTNGFIRLLSYDNTTDGKCLALITCNT